MTKYRVTFNNPMYEEIWIIEDENLRATIQNQMSGAGYVEMMATNWRSKERCLLMFNPGNFSSVEIKELDGNE